MAFKRIVGELKEMKEGAGNKGKKGTERRHFSYQLGRSHIAPELSPPPAEFIRQSRWANMPPELLVDIINRVEGRDTTWPARRDVVACASVCKSWREITKEVVKLPEHSGLLTFPTSLKQPGQREFPIQCFIKRDRATSTYLLYFGLSPALTGEFSKMLLAARRIRRATGTEFVISLDRDDFSQTSNMYVGKLRSNFLGTKFTIVDKQVSNDPATWSKFHHHQRMLMKQVSPRSSANNFHVGTISYELNVLRTRGPRRMNCVMHSVPFSTIQNGNTASTSTSSTNCEAKPSSPKARAKCLKPLGIVNAEPSKMSHWVEEPLILKNKSPRWHEQLQCWCLNFRGRVTVASVKNFQLVASVKPHQSLSSTEQEKVILQFGKIGKDIFTMDYRYPLSAFQAFAICLSSFDTKPACE
uniref:Tubby-like F-box protein n=1 Tax=Kalanchoe fedtschenkoi TaxID=63787 RepID=A0A7N1A7Q9_KALFE